MYDIVILTDKEHAYPNVISDYVKNVIVEDAIVLNALGKGRLKTIRLSWDDSILIGQALSRYYSERLGIILTALMNFQKWLNKVSKQTKLINSEAIIRWNIDKHYLKDLNNNGVHIAETFFIEKGSSKTLESLHEQLGWEETVLKPCVSGGGWHTYRITQENIGNHETIF